MPKALGTAKAGALMSLYGKRNHTWYVTNGAVRKALNRLGYTVPIGDYRSQLTEHGLHYCKTGELRKE